MALLDLTNRKYIVTGASSGIGRAAAIQISRAGGAVVLCGRNAERLNGTMTRMDGHGHSIMPYDLRDLDGISRYVKSCVETAGEPFDGFVFSAGISAVKPLRAENISCVADMFSVNLFSYLAMLKEFCFRRNMKDGGSVVAVSSVSAQLPPKGIIGYSSSKAAMDAASEVAAKELVKRRIRINTLRPHRTDTPMTKAYFDDDQTKNEYLDIYPLGTLTPEDVANSILFLLSDLSSKITGEHITLNAGCFV